MSDSVCGSVKTPTVQWIQIKIETTTSSLSLDKLVHQNSFLSRNFPFELNLLVYSKEQFLFCSYDLDVWTNLKLIARMNYCSLFVAFIYLFFFVLVFLFAFMYFLKLSLSLRHQHILFSRTTFLYIKKKK